MSEELICRSCGIVTTEPKIEQIPLHAGGFHLKASCPDCGAYLKFLPHGGPAALYFGKYKGESIADVAVKDAEYLRWLHDQDWVKSKLRMQIDEALQQHGDHSRNGESVPVRGN